MTAHPTSDGVDSPPAGARGRRTVTGVIARVAAARPAADIAGLNYLVGAPTAIEMATTRSSARPRARPFQAALHSGVGEALVGPVGRNAASGVHRYPLDARRTWAR